MLWVEAASVLVIVTLVALLLVRHGMHWDWDNCACAARRAAACGWAW